MSRRGFIVAEVAVGLAVIAFVASVATVMFVTLTRRVLDNRANAIAVIELGNAVEALKADPTRAPEIGERRDIALSPEIAERYPNLTLSMTSEAYAHGTDLLKVRVVAIETRKKMKPLETVVEVLVAPKRPKGGQP